MIGSLHETVRGEFLALDASGRQLEPGLQASFNQGRQNSIDEELWEVVSRFEALMGENQRI